MYAAPSGTTLTFLSFIGNIIVPGTGTGGNGTYIMDRSASVPPGTTMYTYDTPATIYVTGGPRQIQPQDLIWSDAFPFGTTASQVYGYFPTQMTVITSLSNGFGTVPASVAHSAGSGKMWMLTNGMAGMGDFNSNAVAGFGVGLHMPCQQATYPETGCGQSYASRNVFFDNLVGRLVAGNNSGGSGSEFNEYDHNFIADVAELSTIGSTYIGEMLQGEDESSNTHVLLSSCGINASGFAGIYASGAGHSGSCYASGTGLLSWQPGFVLNHLWFAPVFGATADATYVDGASAQSITCGPGTVSGSFQVQNGRVIHC